MPWDRQTARHHDAAWQARVRRVTPARIGIGLAIGFVILGLANSLWSGAEPGVDAGLDPTARLDTTFTVERDVRSGFGQVAFGRLERIVGRVAEAADSCLRAGTINRRGTHRAELSRLFEIISGSALGRELVARAGREDVYVCVDRDTPLLGYYRAGMRLIGLNPGLSEGQKIVFLAHELAHVPQHDVYSDNRLFPPHDLVLLRRVREATAEAVATRIAWQLRQGGYDTAWREKKADRFYGDIVRAFADELGRNPRQYNELAAARAAFDQWFAVTRRLDLYDRMTVDHLRRISGDHMGLVSPRRELTHWFLIGIARLDYRTPLFETDGQRLTDIRYRGKLSVRNAGFVECLLDGTDAWTEALPPEVNASRTDGEADPWAVLRNDP